MKNQFFRRGRRNGFLSQRGGEFLRLAARGLPTLGPTLFVQIAQAHQRANNLEGPVTVKFDKLPEGVSVKEKASDLKIGEKEKERKFTLTAKADAPVVDKHAANVTATAEKDPKATVTRDFNVTVKKEK